MIVVDVIYFISLFPYLFTYLTLCIGRFVHIEPLLNKAKVSLLRMLLECNRIYIE
jgi:hypothetical protein